MKYQLEPMSYDAAINFLSDKTAVGSGMDSSQWANVPAAIRQRALFSATLENARIAQEMQDYLTDFIAGRKEQNEQGEDYFAAQGRAEFVAKFRELIQDAGIGKTLPDGSIDPFINDGDLRDLRSARRLQLIFDTNIDAAYSYAGWLESQDPDILSIYPCWRFIRVRPVKAPRDYHEAAIDQVARKDDLQFWLSLNRDFNLPYGPWGFNSGCDVEEVDIEEAEQLGIMKPGSKTPKPIIKDFNDQLTADIKNLSPTHRTWLINNLNGYALIEANTLRALNSPQKTQLNTPTQPVKESPKNTLVKKGNLLINPNKTTNQITAQKQRITNKIEQAQKSKKGEAYFRDSLRFLRINDMLVPKKDRGLIDLQSIKFDKYYRVSPKKKQIPQQTLKWMDMIYSVIPANKLPVNLGMDVTSACSRAFHFQGSVKLSTSNDITTIIHELSHAIEYHNSNILSKSAAFLYDRANGEQPKQLRQLYPGYNYQSKEIALEDNWLKKGGSHYAGKLYLNTPYNAKMSKQDFINAVRSSEILSMGVERLIKAPIQFQREDPEYFQFIKEQLWN